MNPISVVIADDEPLARKRLERLLANRADVTLMGSCRDGAETVAAIRDHAPDLLFLDVQMPDPDGFGVIREIGPAAMPEVVFVTAYDAYAIDAFAVSAVDYLLKPFEDARFEQALRRALIRIQQAKTNQSETELTRLLAHLPEVPAARPDHPERLAVHGAHKVYFVNVADIDWIQAEGPYARLHTGNTSHLIRDSIKHLSARLDPRRFLRIHRSTVVNTDRIEELYPRSHGEYDLLICGGTVLKMSRGYRDAAKKALGL